MTFIELLASANPRYRRDQCILALFYSKHVEKQPSLESGQIQTMLVNARVSGARTANISDVLNKAGALVDRDATRKSSHRWSLTATGDEHAKRMLGALADRLVSTPRIHSGGRIRLLFMGVCPDDQGRLRLDQEHREISEKIRKSELRDAFELASAWAVRPDDVLQKLNEAKPHMVHISGHGASNGDIVLEDATGRSKPVNPRAWEEVLTGFQKTARVVVFNVCNSKSVAERVVNAIDFAIGMDGTINDQSAIVFAAAFYRAIGFGETVDCAFRQARSAIIMESLPDDTVPTLQHRKGVDPKVFRVHENVA